MKVKLIPIEYTISNTREMFEALLQGKVLKVGHYNLELLPSGVLNVDLQGGLDNIVKKITQVLEYREVPWYEAMEVGQTVLVRHCITKDVLAISRKQGRYKVDFIQPIPDRVSYLEEEELKKCKPLTPEEVSKFAFANLCN